MPSFSHAETWYDDWAEEVRDVTEAVQHYGGTAYCVYDKHVITPTSTYPFNKNDIVQVVETRYVADTTDPFPTFIVEDDYTTIETGPIYPYEYTCVTEQALLATYVEQTVVGQETVNVPIEPFPDFSRYESGSCMGGTRRGAIEVGNSSIASNMKIRVSKTGFPDIVIYNGVASDSVSFNTSSYGQYNISVKFDNGSSRYFSGNVPTCSTGGGHPF
ncbi:MAG: hypothetical protein GYB58_19400 [Gammaproteobacteria bacterium]|nr:hypothetical protein [Gammaproteobacteria bacterium]